MSEMSIDDIVTLITKQVMDTIAQKKQAAGAADCQGEACVESVRKKVLLVGPKDPLPEGILTGAAIYDIEDFKAERNVLKYDQVIITKLDLAQLSDAANGRTGDPVANAIIYALLEGVDVLMTGCALCYRKFAGKGSSAFYNMYEQFAKKLQIYGVKLLDSNLQLKVQQAVPPKYPSKPAVAHMPVFPAQDSRLVTESDALKLAAGAKDQVTLPAGSILTPLAKDVFTRAKLKVVLE